MADETETNSTTGTPAGRSTRSIAAPIREALKLRLLHLGALLTQGVTLGVKAVVADADERILLVRHGYISGWHFPGGGVEPGETALDAGLRELDEELGLRLGPRSVIGWLDDYPTRSGYLITPVVLWGDGNPTLRPAHDEVLAVYRVSLETLINAEPRFISIPESDRPVLQLPLDNHLIHAPTGAVLYQLRQVGLLAKTGERVDHLEQPVFAWS